METATAPTETTATETPAAAPAKVEQPSPADVLPPSGSNHKAKAQELAAQYLSQRGMKMADIAPKGDAPKAEPKAEPKTKSEEAPTKAEASAEAEAASEPTEQPELEAKAEDNKKAKADEAEKAEREKLDKEWKELRRQKKQARSLSEERRRFELEQATHRAEREADERLRRESPNAWLEKHGYSFQEVAKAAVEKGTETPEQRELREAKDRADAYAKRLEAIEAQIREREQREAIATLKAETVDVIKTEAASYPTLAEHYTPEEIAEAATTLRIDHYRKTQREPLLSDVLAHMERNAARERERFLRTSKSGDGQREPQSRSASSDTARATVASDKEAKPRAAVRPVTNKDAATRASPPQSLSATERRKRSEAMARDFLRGRM